MWTSQLQYEKLKRSGLVFRDLQNKFLRNMLAWTAGIEKLISYFPVLLSDSQEHKTLGVAFAIGLNLPPTHLHNESTPPATAFQNTHH